MLDRWLAPLGLLASCSRLRNSDSIVIIGGAAANLLGYVSRSTTDVDILAFAREEPGGSKELRPPDEPLPQPLVGAAAIVASDLGLDANWLNAGPASQWQTGLPPGLAGRVRWTDYGGLVVGLVDRFDLIFFKLYAAADDTGPKSVHFQDLLALKPTPEELEAAGRWVREQDPSPAANRTVTEVMRRVRDRGRGAE